MMSDKDQKKEKLDLLRKIREYEWMGYYPIERCTIDNCIEYVIYVLEDLRKQYILGMFDDKRKNGIYIPKIFSLKDPIDKLERHYDFFINGKEDYLKQDELVLLNMYMSLKSLEFISEKYNNPIGLYLKGLCDNVENFEEPIRKLVGDGYTKQNPFVELLVSLVSSAIKYKNNIDK